jgi:hypothetical protein
MRITATNTIPGRIDLSSLERYQEDNPIEELHFHATIGPNEFMDVDDKWYTLIQIQNSLALGWITITDFDEESTLPHAPTHTNGADNIAEMVGDSGSGGTIGLVPAPAAGDAAAGKYLDADGTWTVPPGGGGGGGGVAESTGVLTGGILSTGTAATEYSISDGTGQVVNAAGVITAVTWTGKTNITPTALLTHLITFVGIDSSGNVVEQTTRFTNVQNRSIIELGVVVHVDKTIVDAVDNEQHVAYNTGNQLSDLSHAIGFFNIAGNLISANGVNLNIDKSLGTMYGVGINYNIESDDPNTLSLAALTAATFQYRFSNGDNGVTGIALDPANLDDGAGGLTPLSNNNRWSIQRVYLFTNNNIKIQRGVEEFNTQNEAIAGISTEAFITEPSIDANGLLRGYIIAKKNATDLSDPDEAIFIEAPRFKGGGSVGGGSGGGTWGGITGTLSDQLDLQAELDQAKRYTFMMSGG